MNFREIYSQPEPILKEKVNVSGDYKARIGGIKYITIPAYELGKEDTPAILISYDIDGNKAYYHRIKFDTTDAKKIKFRLKMLVDLLISLGRENVVAAIEKSTSVRELANYLSDLHRFSPDKDKSFILHLHDIEYNGQRTVGINALEPPYIKLLPITYKNGVR